MSAPIAKAIIVTCMDFRLQDEIEDWISKNYTDNTFDRVAIAGDVKDLQEALDQVSISRNLHHIKEVVFINHEDCGAYGKDGTYQKHVHDLKHARTRVHELFPELKVRIFYLHLDGKFEEINEE